MTWLSIRLMPLALAGCASQPPGASAMIAPGLPFVTPAPGSLGRPIDAEQLVTAHYQGETYSFQAHVHVDPEKLLLIGLDPLGRRAMTVTETRDGVTVDVAPWVPAGLKPENILADMAIIYWPEAAVRRGLAASATLSAAPQHRSIVVDGRPIIEVAYDTAHLPVWDGIVHFRNEAFGYQLDLRSTPSQP
jgi:hypothetical protein